MSLASAKNATTLPQSPDDIVVYVRDFLEANERPKEARTVLIQLCEDQYEGIQWMRFDSTNGQLVYDHSIRRGIVLNYIQYALGASVAAMVGDRYIPDTYSTGNSPEDYRASLVGRAALYEVFLRNGGFTRQQERGLTTRIRGDHFVRVEIEDGHPETLFFDSPEQLQRFIMETQKAPITAPEQTPVGQIAATFRVGHVVERDVNPANIVVPTGITDFKDAERFAEVFYLPLANARRLAERMGVNADAIMPVEVYDTRAVNIRGEYIHRNFGGTYLDSGDSQEGYRFTKETGLCQFCRYWEMDSTGQWAFVFTANEDFSTYLGGQGGLMSHNIVKYSGLKPPSKFWSIPEIKGVVQLQNALNKLETAELTYLRRAVKDAWVVPQGTKIVGLGGKEGPKLIQYNPLGSHVPQFISAGSAQLSALNGKKQEIKSTMLQLMRISEQMQGRVADRVSTETMNMSRQWDLTTLQMMWQQFKDSDTLKWELSLAMMRQSPEFSVPRLAAYVGVGGEVAAMEFKSGDLRGTTRIRTKSGVPLSQTTAERRQEALTLMSAGFFNPMPEGETVRRMVAQYVDHGSLTVWKPPQQEFTEAQAHEENKLVRTGMFDVAEVQDINPVDGQTILVQRLLNARSQQFFFNPRQDHHGHIELHDHIAQDTRVDARIRQAIELHIQEHQFFVDQQNAAALEEQLAISTEQSIADAAGTITAAQVNAEQSAADAEDGEGGKNNKGSKPKPKSTPRGGGIKSGKVRSK